MRLVNSVGVGEARGPIQSLAHALVILGRRQRLPDDVRAALLTRDGKLGHLLRVVEALERTDDAGVANLLAQGDPCPTSELPTLQIEALSWSNALGQPRAGS